MIVHALVTGSLFRAPEQRMAKTGREFVAATIRVKEGDGSQFVRLVAFSESVQAELMRLADGDTSSPTECAHSSRCLKFPPRKFATASKAKCCLWLKPHFSRGSNERSRAFAAHERV
jgi:hypothetical protein